MNIKSLAAASLIAAATTSSFAAPGDELASFSFNCNGASCASFLTGLSPSVPYDWEVSITTTGSSFLTGVAINNTPYIASGKLFQAMGGTETGPFSLQIFSATSGNPNTLNFGGSVTLTQAVPEPETYALMLAGLGAIGFMARRRRS